MKFLVVGSGGRESAIIKSLTKKHDVYCLSSSINPAIQENVVEYFLMGSGLYTKLLNIIKTKKIDIVIPGSESMIAKGISDYCSYNNYCDCIAPIKDMARIESSKLWCRKLLFYNQNLKKYNPMFINQDTLYTQDTKKTFDTCDLAYNDFMSKNKEYVIKYDGLKGGKGVYVYGDHFENDIEGKELINLIKKDNDDFIIEEKLLGEEFSLFTFSDGKSVFHSPPVKDFKRAYENDKGSNTGGMGSISVFNNNNYLFDFLDEKSLREAEYVNSQVIQLLNSMYSDIGYVGILYGSFMKTADSLKVIEFNCRLGDSEAINVLHLLETDLGEVFKAMSSKNLHTISPKWKKTNTVVKYIVPNLYPKVSSETKSFRFNDKHAFDEHEYVSSITKSDDRFILGQSRSIAILGEGDTLDLAYKNCEDEIKSFLEKIDSKDIFRWRKDIGLPKDISYRTSGVDIDKNDALVSNIKSIVENTYNECVMGNHGSFGGQFILNKSIYKNSNPILVSSTDGVGTKTILLSERLKNEGFYRCGIDIVNHCVNDILVMGAYPLFFLDYFASENLEVDKATDFVKGCSEACKSVGCVLSGGETAEMPLVYNKGHFDVVGTIVGIKHIIFNPISVGDIVISMPSSGPHTNGYSLIRKCIEKEEPSSEIMEKLLTPHKSYLNNVKLINKLFPTIIKNMCHITGGGVRNIARILPEGMNIEIINNMDIPDWCKWIQKVSGMSDSDMFETFNMGIGLLIILDKSQYSLFKQTKTIGFRYKEYGLIKEI